MPDCTTAYSPCPCSDRCAFKATPGLVTNNSTDSRTKQSSSYGACRGIGIVMIR